MNVSGPYLEALLARSAAFVPVGDVERRRSSIVAGVRRTPVRFGS